MRLGVIGLIAAVVAVVMFGITLDAGNRDIGFGKQVTEAEQVGLFLAANAAVCGSDLGRPR
jgi:hypothetical protein